MLIQTEAQIYLEGQRGCLQTDGFRSFRTFNFEEYEAEGRESFGKLLAVNDETLLPERSHALNVTDSCDIILLPLVGGIELGAAESELRFIDSGEAFTFRAFPDREYTVTNPYSEAAINYLQIRLGGGELNFQNQHTKFDLLYKNTLLPVHSGGKDEVNVYIGKYGGREEGVFIPDFPNRGVFTFIIEGAFEVRNRLLEKRDGLSVCGAEEIEFEALSNDAVILVIAV